MIVAGFGFRGGAGTASLAAALAATGGPLPAALAAPADKAAALAPLAAQLGLPVLALSPGMLTAEVTLTRSAASLRARGTGSVAEASALAGSRQQTGMARLLGPRVLSPDRKASCALATGEMP